MMDVMSELLNSSPWLFTTPVKTLAAENFFDNPEAYAHTYPISTKQSEIEKPIAVLANITNNTDSHILHSFNNSNFMVCQNFIQVEKPTVVLLNSTNDSENQRPHFPQPFSMAQRKWTKEEDLLLSQLCSQSLDANRDWLQISKHFVDRQRCSIKDRWEKVLNPYLVKGNFTKEEDAKILELVARLGSEKRWNLISKSLPGRLGK